MKARLIIIFASLLVIFSCRKGSDPPNWDIDTFVPLVTSSLKLEESFDDSLISKDEDGKLKLIYKGNLLSIELDSDFSIPDTTVREDFTVPFGSITIAPAQPIIVDTQSVSLNVNTLQLKKLIILQGEVELSVRSTLIEQTIFEYRLPAASKNGVTLQSSLNVPAGSLSNPSVVSQVIDLSGYTLDLTGFDKRDFNQVDIIYSATLDPNAPSNIVVNAGNFIRFTNTFKDVVPEYGQGFFGTETESQIDKNEIDVFNNFSNGSLTINKANLILEVENEVGMDVSATIHKLKGSNSNSGNETALNFSIIGNQINLNRATIDSSLNYPYIIPSSKSFFIDDQNSNVTDFISDLPDSISFNIDFTTNPIGNSSNGLDFVYNNTGLRVNLDAEIPLNIAADQLLISDTTEFSIDPDSQEEADKINGGQLLFHTWNGYPLDAELQFYFMNESQQIIDSAFVGPQFLPSGVLNSADSVIDASFATLPLSLNKERIDRLYTTEYILIKATISTSGYPNPVQLYNHYAIDVKLIGDFSYNIDPDNF